MPGAPALAADREASCARARHRARQVRLRPKKLVRSGHQSPIRLICRTNLNEPRSRRAKPGEGIRTWRSRVSRRENVIDTSREMEDREGCQLSSLRKRSLASSVTVRKSGKDTDIRRTQMTTLRRFALGIGFSLLTVSTAHASPWAHVYLDGTLEKSRCVIANYHEGPGFYRIIFSKNIEKCVPSVIPDTGLIKFAAHLTASPGEVVVWTANDVGYLDASFYIALIC